MSRDTARHAISRYGGNHCIVGGAASTVIFADLPLPSDDRQATVSDGIMRSLLAFAGPRGR